MSGDLGGGGEGGAATAATATPRRSPQPGCALPTPSAVSPAGTFPAVADGERRLPWSTASVSGSLSYRGGDEAAAPRTCKWHR